MVHRAAEPGLMYAQGNSLKLKSAILMLWIFLLKFCLLLPLSLPCLSFLCLCAFMLSVYFHLSDELTGLHIEFIPLRTDQALWKNKKQDTSPGFTWFPETLFLSSNLIELICPEVHTLKHHSSLHTSGVWPVVLASTVSKITSPRVKHVLHVVNTGFGRLIFWLRARFQDANLPFRITGFLWDYDLLPACFINTYITEVITTHPP